MSMDNDLSVEREIEIKQILIPDLTTNLQFTVEGSISSISVG